MTDHTKIYLAARYHSKFTNPDNHNPHLAEAGKEPYPYHLESYHYAKGEGIDTEARRRGDKLFMDSGAFTMFTKGATVNLDAYGKYLINNADVIEVASSVDVIGAGKEKASYDSFKYLEAMRLPVAVCPVHHARDSDDWLARYLDEGYEYIFLGGMVPETTGYLYDWLDHIWDKYLALPDGTARVKIHGFGLTTFELMERYPWYSVDSTSWLMIAMFGNVLINVNGKVKAMSVSDKSPNTKDEGKSFWNLDAATQAHWRKQFAAAGFTPEDLATCYGKRSTWNIKFFKQYMDRLTPTFTRRAITFF